MVRAGPIKAGPIALSHNAPALHGEEGMGFAQCLGGGVAEGQVQQWLKPCGRFWRERAFRPFLCRPGNTGRLGGQGDQRAHSLYTFRAVPLNSAALAVSG